MTGYRPTTMTGRTMRYKKGPDVDPADVMPDGAKFKNIDDFKQLLLKDKDQLARALAERGNVGPAASLVWRVHTDGYFGWP